MSEESLHAPAWAEAFVRDRVFLVHTDTGTIGRATALHPPDPKPVFNDNTTPRDRAEGVTCWTLEIDPGHRFVACEESFMLLEPKSAAFYASAQTILSAYVAETVRLAASQGLGVREGMQLLTSALQSQADLARAAVDAEW